MGNIILAAYTKGFASQAMAGKAGMLAKHLGDWIQAGHLLGVLLLSCSTYNNNTSSGVIQSLMTEKGLK